MTLIGASSAKTAAELPRACPAAASRDEPANPVLAYVVSPTAFAIQSLDDVSRISVCLVCLLGGRLDPSGISGAFAPS